jgi:mono/diheme cytochrome c family protein
MKALSTIVLIAAMLAASCATRAGGAELGESDDVVRPFFETHCFVCHGEDAQEGKLRLDQLAANFMEDDVAERWLSVLRKIESGDMPPDGETRPATEDVRNVSAWIRNNLVKANQERQRVDGRVVLRRLNRVEYQNTINDLFAIDVDLEDLLPEDASAHGFDNIGEALNISSVLLERYLEAADVALDAAIVTGPCPETTTRRFSYKDERRVNNHKSYKVVDDAVVFFSSGYSPTEISQFRARVLGEYRIRVSAYAYQSATPVTFRVYGGVGVKKHLAGYFDVAPDPTVAEFTTRLGGRNTIRVVPFGTQLAKWNKAAEEKGPGLAVQWVEIEGPLIDQWPPESHRRLFGDMAIKTVNAAEVRQNRRSKPLLEVVSASPHDDAKAILDEVLPKMFRRPVDAKKADPYLAIVDTTLDKGYSFQNAVRVALKAAMCSPDFLYLAEPSGATLDDFQVASRLSYFLWSTLPDDEMLDLAAKGKLASADVLRQQTERMLADPRCEGFIKNFVGQWLKLREIDFTTPDAILYPEFDELLKISMVQETERFFAELLTHDLSVLNIVDSDFTIVNERLAQHYGVEGVVGQEFRRVRLAPELHRGGVITQASVLKVTANGTNTSPVLRGVWLLDNIFDSPVPPPPANVPAVEPDIRGATTIREQLAKHRQVASCASCHKRIDPAGFALENFDVIGGWREHYRSVGDGQRLKLVVNGRTVKYKQGLPVVSADVLPTGESFRDVDEFKRLLLQDPDRIALGLTKKLLTYATGSGIQWADNAEAEAIVKRVKSKEYGLKSIVHEVVQSKMFLHK